MIRTLLRAAPLCALGLTTPLLAQTSVLDGTDVAESLERELVIEGNTPSACILRTPTASGGINATLTQASNGGATIELSPQGFIDPATGVPRATSIAVSLGITCNTAHRVRVVSAQGGLLREGGGVPAGGAFRSRLDFAVSISWAGISGDFQTASASQIDIPVPDAATGAATISISIPGGGTPLVAGVYGDTLTIEVEATS